MSDHHSDVESDSSDIGDIFQEPTGFYQTAKPATTVDYTLENGRILNLRFVGQNPLWGHLLWNAGQVITRYLQERSDTLIREKTILELGAGGGLPSLACAVYGAAHVAVTDYPDPELISNLQHNIEHCLTADEKSRIVAQGLLWGDDPKDILAGLNPATGHGFDVLILADILFNHSEHVKLLASVQATLKHSAQAKALVFFTPYRPWLLEKDLDFFTLARADGFYVEKVLEHTMDKVMFDNDPGDEKLRRTVFGYILTRNSQQMR